MSLENKQGAWAASAFALVLLVVGFPVWWYTTMVYRAALPHSQISDLSRQLKYHTVLVELIGNTNSSFEDQLKDKLNPYSYLGFSLIRFSVLSKAYRKKELEIIESSESLDLFDKSFNLMHNTFPGTLTVLLIPNNNKLVERYQIVIGRYRSFYIGQAVDISDLVLVLQSAAFDPIAGQKLGFLSKFNASNFGQTMRQLPTVPAYDLTITVMMPEPHVTRAEWNAEASVKSCLQPFVDNLKGIADFTIRTQNLYMTPLNIAPVKSHENKCFILPEDQLPHTINVIESKLGSYVSARPMLHFIVYIPRRKYSPLLIYTKNGLPLETNSFLVPRWGGVMIHNIPDIAHTEEIPYALHLDTHFIMKTIVSQLYKLLPVPFISLCELVGEISNMVISDEVAGYVWGAVSLWKDCSHAASEGRLAEAVQYCSEAFTLADDAFFHPSMLGRLYFPDNQKYAIYVPLFLPVSIPVIMSFKIIYQLLKSQYQKEKLD